MFSGRRLLNTSRQNTGTLSATLLQLSSCLCNANLAFHTVLCPQLISLLSLSSCSHKQLPLFQHLPRILMHDILATTYQPQLMTQLRCLQSSCVDGVQQVISCTPFCFISSASSVPDAVDSRAECCNHPEVFCLACWPTRSARG